MEHKIRTEIEFQYKSKLNHRETHLDKEMRKFTEFKNDLIASIGQTVT